MPLWLIVAGLRQLGVLFAGLHLRGAHAGKRLDFGLLAICNHLNAAAAVRAEPDPRDRPDLRLLYFTVKLQLLDSFEYERWRSTAPV
jgi:hypothetical protein